MAYSSRSIMVDAETAKIIREREARLRARGKIVLMAYLKMMKKDYEDYKKKVLYETALDYVSK